MTEPTQGRSGWTLEEANRYERARALVSAVIAAYSSRIGKASREDAAILRNQQRTYVLERGQLGVHDRAQIQRILDDYPPLLRRVREGEQ
ncbi:hypothetical protein ACIQ7Q_33660 [Streptomyces sp. NPDC096176]|uniref:hypothetical protein n=1 Tax=Streptomyces sp. NPDC096176 TaxID=3366079 RepID=UPI0037F3CC84